MRINDIVLTGIAAEVFSATTRRIRETSPVANTIPLGYSNGVIGYLPTADAYPAGGWDISDRYRVPDMVFQAYLLPTALAPDSEARVVDARAGPHLGAAAEVGHRIADRGTRPCYTAPCQQSTRRVRGRGRRPSVDSSGTNAGEACDSTHGPGVRGQPQQPGAAHRARLRHPAAAGPVGDRGGARLRLRLGR